MNGTLVYEDYLSLYNRKKIKSLSFKKSQIQPSSIDLSLSEECYEIKTSFLSPDNKVRDKLKKIYSKKITLKTPKIFKKNKTYIVKLNETLNLSNSITGHCNPKSSTGRLNIFCRTILDYCDEYEKIPNNYKGEMFLEITTRSFDIKISKGDKLNQMRLRKKINHYLNDRDLKKINKRVILTSNSPDFYFKNSRNLIDEFYYENKRLPNDNEKILLEEKKFSFKGKRTDKINELLKKISKKNNIQYLNKEEYLCSYKEKKCYVLTDKDEKINTDSSHLTLAGAKFFGKKIHELDWLKIN